MKNFLFGLLGLFFATAVQAQNTFLASDGTFKTVPNAGLDNMAANRFKCNPTGGVAAPQDCTGAQAEQLLQFTSPGTGAVQRLLDAKLKDNVYVVTDFGADSTGATANLGASFNAAMAACVFAGPLGIALNGTVYIPKGFYKLGTTVMTWSKGCNIVADPGAYIQANVSVANLLVSGIGASNSLDSVHLIGGQWDCNANVTDSGFKIPDFARVHLNMFRMYGCNGNAGNGSIGGFIRLGGASTVQSFEMHIDNAFLYNFTSPIATLVTGNFGIFSDPSSTTGPTDSRLTNIEIVGTSIGVQGRFFDGIFTRVHAYVFPSQGNMTNGFQLTSGQIRLIANQVDGPLASGKAAYDLAGTPYTMISNGYFENTNNNVSNFANLASGVTLFSYGNHLLGNSASFKILTDYTGTLTGLNAGSDFAQNVSTVVGAYGAIISGVNGSFGGSLLLKGATSGTVTQTAQAVAGTPAVVWGTASGTPAVTASAPLAIAASTGNATCATCATTTNGGPLSATAPISISAGGNISFDSTAWTTFTPTPACGTATFTVNSSRSKTYGKTTFVEADISISTLGTCTNNLFFNLPNTANSGAGLVGRDLNGTGGPITCVTQAAGTFTSCFSGANLNGTSKVIVSGVYENQ